MGKEHALNLPPIGMCALPVQSFMLEWEKINITAGDSLRAAWCVEGKNDCNSNVTLFSSSFFLILRCGVALSGSLTLYFSTYRGSKQ